MEVILLETIKKLGKYGEQVTVKNGFGRNYLLPQNKAIRATKSNMEQFEARKQEIAQRNNELKAAAEKVASEIRGKDFTFIRQSSDDGRLYGSVSPKEIADKMNSTNKSYELSHNNVEVANAIKALGVYEVNIHLYAEVDAKILINVARTESEAIEALKSFKHQGNTESAEEAA